MKVKRAWGVLLAMAMTAGLAAGCGGTEAEVGMPEEKAGQGDADQSGEVKGGSGEVKGGSGGGEWFGTEDGETVTLQFWGGIQPEYGYDEIERNFNEEYKDKGVQIQYNRYKNDTEGNLQLETYLMAGEEGGVDVFIGYGNKSKVAERAEAGLLYDYSGYLKEKGFDIAKELGENAATEYIFEGGEVWGLPTKFDNGAYLMINTDMFEEAGIDIPYDGWTYEEFLEAIASLTEGEGQEKVYGMCWGFDFSDSQWRAHINSVLGNNETFADDSMTTVNWEDPVWIEGLELVMETFEKGYAPTLADDIADSMTVENMFLEEKCAIFGIFSQLRLAMDTETYPHDFTTALVPFPVPDESFAEFKTQAQSNYSGDFMCIASGCQYKEAACEFARWYIQGGMNPLIKSARYPLWLGTDMDDILAYVKEVAGDSVDVTSLEYLFSTDRASYTKPSYVNPKSSELSTILWEECQDFLYGKTPTAKEAMQKAAERGNALLAE